MALTLNGDGTITGSVVNTDATNTRVGIGTNTPEHMLHLKGSYPYIAFEDTDNANTSIGSITGNSDGNIYYDANFNNDPAVSGGHRWRINGATSTPMYIDQTTGIVVKPNQPYAHVRRGNTTYSQANSSDVLYSEVITSRNLTWNPSTGGFTVPVTGIYAITASLRLEAYTGGYMYYHILANGSAINSSPHYLGQPDKTDGFATQTVSTTALLTQNDAITFRWSWSGGGTYNSYGLQTYVSVAFIG